GDGARDRARAQGACGRGVRERRNVRARQEGLSRATGRVASMPKLTIYNLRGELEAEGEVPSGTNLLQASVKLGAKHGSACGGVCSCSTCPVWVKKGFDSLSEQEDNEADILDRAFDVKPYSRLGCQAEVSNEAVVYQI